jgi:hypothetical protein
MEITYLRFEISNLYLSSVFLRVLWWLIFDRIQALDSSGVCGNSLDM